MCSSLACLLFRYAMLRRPSSLTWAIVTFCDCSGPCINPHLHGLDTLSTIAIHPVHLVAGQLNELSVTHRSCDICRHDAVISAGTDAMKVTTDI